MIIIIYCALYIYAVSYIRYCIGFNLLWQRIYILSAYIIIIISVIYFGIKKTLKLDKKILFLSNFILYEFIVSLCNSIIIMPFIAIDILLWPLLFCVFYDYTKQNNLPNCFKILTIIGMISICLFSIPNIVVHISGYGRNGGVIFPTYFCFAFLPMVYITYPKKISRFFSILVVILMMVSTKRAGFIIVVTGLMLLLLVEALIQNTMKKTLRRIGVFVVIGVAAIIISLFLIQKFNLNIFNRLTMLSADEGSGRIAIWELVFGKFTDSSFLKKIFGHGYQSVYYRVRPFGKEWLSHNSFLEVLYDYGIIGLTAIICIIVTIIKKGIKLIKSKNIYAPIICYSLVAVIIMAACSYFFEQSVIIIPFSVFLGIVFGNTQQERGRIKF